MKNYGINGASTAGCEDAKGVDVWSASFDVTDRPPELRVRLSRRGPWQKNVSRLHIK